MAERVEIDDRYVMEPPNPQLAIDLSKAEWASRFPAAFGVTGGAAGLFEDPRVQWMVQQAGGLAGKRVLELGPLEAGHTYMIENFGASRIVSIEANYRAFLKCLIIKNMLNLKAQFLLGDFVKYLEKPGELFDFLIASGVLYHMTDPLKLLYLISQRSNQVAFGHITISETSLRRTRYCGENFRPKQLSQTSTADFGPSITSSFILRRPMIRDSAAGRRRSAIGWIARRSWMRCGTLAITGLKPPWIIRSIPMVPV